MRCGHGDEPGPLRTELSRRPAAWWLPRSYAALPYRSTMLSSRASWPASIHQDQPHFNHTHAPYGIRTPGFVQVAQQCSPGGNGRRGGEPSRRRSAGHRTPGPGLRPRPCTPSRMTPSPPVPPLPPRGRPCKLLHPCSASDRPRKLGQMEIIYMKSESSEP
eukprot:2087504-Rhodomonas_salina.1